MPRFPANGAGFQSEVTGPVTLTGLPAVNPAWGVLQTISNRELEHVSLADNLTAAERADAQSYAPTIDTTAKVQAIIDYHTTRKGATIEVPWGQFIWNNLVLKTGVSLSYEGYRGETGRSPSTLRPCVIQGTTGPWIIDTPSGASFGQNVIGLELQGPGTTPSCGGIRFQNVTRGSVCGTFVNNVSEWGILQVAGFANLFMGNLTQACLLDRTRAIDPTTLPHGTIEIRGTDNWDINGEYTASMSGVFGAATVTGTAQAATATTMTLQAGSSAVNSFYNGYLVEITGGTGAGQQNYISSYVGGTLVATMVVQWGTTPDATSTYLLTPMRCAAGAFKNCDNWISNGIYELSELGMWISNPPAVPPVHAAGISLDQNSGPGGIFIGAISGGAGCSSQRNSKAVDGVYDDVLLLGQQAGVLSGWVTGGYGSDANQARHGFHDACSPSTVADANRWIIESPSRHGNRRGKIVKQEASPTNRNAAVDLAAGVLALTANSATPSMDGWRTARFQYTVPTNVTQIADVIEGVVYVFTANNGNVTLVNGASIKTQTGASFTLSATATFMATAYNGVLYQLSDTYLSTLATPLAYSASITPDAALGTWQTITATNGTAFTINAPTHPPDATHSQELTIEVLNSSGGVLGAITWNAAFIFAAGAWTNPASTKKRFAQFRWNGTAWVGSSVATADY